MAAQFISVVICTYSLERWDDLTATVESVQKQIVPPLETIIVVDHNPDLFGRALNRLPNVTVIENNGQKGLSGARNAGVNAAIGELIAFFDDDEVLTPDCLFQLGQRCNEPGVLGAGGRIIPRWLAPRPGWFPEEFGWVLGYSYLGLPVETEPVRNLIGGSMCFHREVFEQVGGFRNGIGRINALPLGCEETEFCIRLLQRWPDWKLIYEPQAVVLHRTPPERASWRYFFRRCFNEGISKAAITRFVGSYAGLSSERSYTARVLPAGILKGLGDFFIHRDKWGLARAGAILAGLVCTTAGYIYGSLQGWRQRLGARPKKQAGEETA